MRLHLIVRGLMTLTWAAALACASAVPASAARRATPRETQRVETQEAEGASRSLPVSRERTDENSMRLGRAVMEQSLGNRRGVVENLEAIDFSRESSFAEADRAAFLLGQAYLGLGSVDRFVELARRVSRWERKSVYTECLILQLRLAEVEGARGPASVAAPGGFAAVPADSIAPADSATAGADSGAAPADSATAALDELLTHGSPALARFESLARATQATNEAALTQLATADTASALGRDLAAAAILRLATRALERGEDPRALLETVPAGTRHTSRARHMLGLIALEHGETERGTRVLDSLMADDSSYTARREVMLVLAGQALDRGRWDVAHEAYQGIDQEWTRHRDELKRILERSDFDALWLAWRSGTAPSDAVMLDGIATRAAVEPLVQSSLDLSTRPAGPAPPLNVPPATRPLRWPVTPPPAEAWNAIAASARGLGEAGHDLERARWNLARERERIEEQKRYLASGGLQVRREAADLEARAALLDSLRNALDALDTRLRRLRDESTRRIVRRASALAADCGLSLRWIRAMRHFQIDGPNRERAVAPPTGLPRPDSLLDGEEQLTRAVQSELARMAAELPGLIERSYRLAWRPNLIDRAAALGREANRALAWARALNASIDSSIAAASASETLQRLAAQVEVLERRADSLVVAHVRLRERVARQAVEKTLAALEPEREAIDYGLAASVYGLGVHLSATSDSTAAAARGHQRAADSSHVAAAEQELDDPEAVRWRGEAITRLRDFLGRHPRSFARGEMRFRLADLLLVEARADFRARMARFIRAQSEGTPGVELPVLSYGPALELYRAILAEDRDFAHRDAVLFNAGMILADEANPEAARFFGDLVAEFPDSPYAQEAYLRMGDMHFIAKRYRDGVPLYEKAAAGPDPGLKAIALYKLGWAHFNEDRFLKAADAFREVLDLYASGRKIEIQADVEAEAEAYLVHSLAGAGGAEAFAQYFDRIGPRPYERRVLMALGQNYRRLGQYADAIAADQLFLQRYPNHPDALVSARRLTETYQRWNRPDLTRGAQLEYAPRFAPSSGWFDAQTSDSVRAAGGEFARTSLKAVALHYHKKARDKGSPEDWKTALQMYETLLSRWPNDPEAPTLDLHAGEASARLGDYKKALAHYGAAAAGNDSIATQALWQKVAVTDAWYESTRPPASPGRPSLGRGSLAGATLIAGDELLARFPNHPEGANLMWRQGNLSFSHGWFDRAALDFAKMATRYPHDRRRPLALGLRADALFQVGNYEQAGPAYEETRVAARSAGIDSLERRAAEAVPICAFHHAESAVEEDSTNYARHAELFEKVAARWPGYEHAHVAQYKAGLAHLKAGAPKEGIRAMEALIRDFPKSEYVRDAHLQVAKSWEGLGQSEQAGQAYARFAERFPDDPSARDAWLKAADLYAAGGLAERAERQRLAYIAKFPDDVETAMEILEALARRDLASVGPNRPISMLLPASQTATTVKGRKGKRAAARVAPAGSQAPSHLAVYLERAKSYPKLASRSLLAQVEFLRGEEAYAACAAARLSQPLKKSLPAKQKLLDEAIARYRKSVDLGDSEWGHASAFRIGQALVGFGEAIENSERPADLHGDDLLAYQDVLMNRSQAFYERGENVWAELLRQKGRESQDEWIVRAQKALWPRLATRFLFRPEAEFPVVTAPSPDKPKHEKEPTENSLVPPPGGVSGDTHTVAKPEGGER